MSKKAILLFALCSIFLLNCTYNKEISKTNKKDDSICLFFSEFLVTNNYSQRILEIANYGSSSVDLSSFSVNIYKNNSREITYSFPLEGNLGSGNTYVITADVASEEMKNKADLISDQFINPGSWAMTLTKDSIIYDILGKIGYSYKYACEKDIVRKKEYFYGEDEFNEYHFVSYPYNQLDHIGNLDVINEETLLKGPRLSEEFMNTPFTNNGNTGTGGVLQSKVLRYVDGDTSYFEYGRTYAQYGVSGSLSTRYYGVNTPEIAHSFGEVSDPYGDEAKEFTNAKLAKSKSVLIQSVKNYSLHETYGRMLAYIWISEKENANREDYELLNFLIIKEGFSNIAFTESNLYQFDMSYLGLTYVDYLEHAQAYATASKLNIHS